MSQNILVIKLGALGDFIYSFGAMAAIRSAHPDAVITLLTTKAFVQMAEASGYFDRILVDKKPKMFDFFGWFFLRKTLNNGCFSRVYDLQNNDRTAIYLRLFSPRPEWVGAAKGASHRNDSPDRSSGHAFHGHVQTLKIGGIDSVSLDSLDWMKGEIDSFSLPKPYVILVAGSSPQHPEKRWPVESFRMLAGKLIRHGYHPVLIGAAAEKEVNAEISRGMDGVIDLTGKTGLFDLPALARGSAGAVGNDTGPIHIMCVTGCPTIVLFCTQKSTIKKHGPQGEKVYAFEADQLRDVAVSDVFSVIPDFFRAH